MLSNDLIERLRRRADDPSSFIDMPKYATFVRHAPATEGQLHDAEQELGFAIAPPLRQLYTEVANGGFGPGYGLLGIVGGAVDDRGSTAEQIYGDFSTPDPEDPSWTWRDGVLPFCYWGCIVYSCIDSNGLVLGFDEGSWDDRAVPLDEWLDRWLAGALTQPNT